MRYNAEVKSINSTIPRINEIPKGNGGCRWVTKAAANGVYVSWAPPAAAINRPSNAILGGNLS